MTKHEPLTKPEFEEWATEIKSSLNGIEDRLERHEVILHEHTRILNGHTRILEQMATSLSAIRENTDAMLKLYRRVEHRTEVLAAKVGLDLRQVDSAT